MTVPPFAFVAAGYLLGAFPSSYVVALRLKGVDIRASGSGNVGASNLSEHTGKLVGIAVGLFDIIGKVTVPIILIRLLDQSLAVQAAAGLAAVVGHNWSPYIRMTGGRGISATVGVMLAFAMWQEILIGIALVGIVGALWLKDMAFWTFIVIVALPGLVLFFGRDAEIVALFACLAVVLLAKRLTGNWDWPGGQHYNWKSVLLHRLLWDRDVRRQEEWIRRGIERKAT